MTHAALLAALTLAAALPAAAAFPAGQDPMTAPVPAGYYAFQKVVYQNDGGLPDDRTYFDMILRNVANHLEAVGGKAEIRVVSFGRGVALFQLAKTDPELAGRIDALKARGVRFLVCRNTLKGMKLRPEDLYRVAPADVIPSGVAEIARLQGRGFVYVHP